MILQVFDQWTPFVERVIRATDPTTIVETGVFDRDPVPQWGIERESPYYGMPLTQCDRIWD